MFINRNPKDTTKKFLELIKELSKPAGNGNLYTNNELSEREIKKTIQLIRQ